VASGGRRSATWVFATAVAAFALDRVTKAWAEGSLRGRPPIRVVPGLLDLRFTTNSGGAFSIGQRAPWLFAGASIAVAVAIVLTSHRHRYAVTAIALGLVLGGSLGNLTDRLVRGPGFSGRVIDFIDLHVWPIFNLADSAIVLGAVLLAVDALRHRERRAEPVEGHHGD
jgi:signal peptidase II